MAKISAGAAVARKSASHKRVPTGVTGRPRNDVRAFQRIRILRAMTELACERRSGSPTVGSVIARAGVSRSTFYELFSDCQECLLEAFNEASARAGLAVSVAYRAEHRWVVRVRGGLLALLLFFDQEPQCAQLCVVQSLAGGPVLLGRRAEIVEQLVAIIDEGRAAAPAGGAAAPLAGEGVVGAVLAILHKRLLTHDPAPLAELSTELMSLIVLPYLGPAAAYAELSRPLPKSAARRHRRSREGLSLRVTYRTLRVLTAVGRDPGASNREIARDAGVVDGGQISKLLARLARLELIENTGDGQPKGKPNAWTMTPKGADLLHGLRTDSEPVRVLDE
jgi:AcrR family transcriptional regulator